MIDGKRYYTPTKRSRHGRVDQTPTIRPDVNDLTTGVRESRGLVRRLSRTDSPSSRRNGEGGGVPFVSPFRHPIEELMDEEDEESERREEPEHVFIGTPEPPTHSPHPSPSGAQQSAIATLERE